MTVLTIVVSDSKSTGLSDVIFAHPERALVMNFQTTEFADRPVPKTLNIYVCEMSVFDMIVSFLHKTLHSVNFMYAVRGE